MISSHRRYRRRIAVIASIFAIVVLYHFFSIRSSSETVFELPQHVSSAAKATSRPATGAVAGAGTAETSYAPSSSEPLAAGPSPSVRPDADDGTPYCPPLPGMEDVLVVMKTGVTESLDKVPVHFNTTLSCVPDYVIFSDFEEEIEGVRVRDAFRNMDQQTMLDVPDFALYNRLKKNGRAGLVVHDFADEANSAFGKPSNPGWKLDKWKFLPMVQEVLRYRDDAKWYVFIEADTYMSWSTLAEYLKHVPDPEKAWYIGTETQIADVIFAHGGSGFILSKKAIQLAADAYASRTADLNKYTEGHWAGDCVLGKVLADEGVGLTFSWPILQNSNIGELDEFSSAMQRTPWCFPALAFHHLSAADIQRLWAYEQERWKRKDYLLLHSDVYRELIHPNLTNPTRESWDNYCAEEQDAAAASSFEECFALCKKDSHCAQYLFKEGKCFTHKSPRLGAPSPGNAQSGWMLDRIQMMFEKKKACKAPDFGF